MRTFLDMIHDCPSCGAQNRVPAARLGARAHCGRCKGDLLPLAGPLPVRSEAEFDELVRDSQLPVVVDFWASWCPPCRAVAPELESLAKTQAGQAVVAKVDTDALPRLAARFGIRSIPTMVLFRGGQEAKRVSGAMPAPAIAAQLALLERDRKSVTLEAFLGEGPQKTTRPMKGLAAFPARP